MQKILFALLIITAPLVVKAQAIKNNLSWYNITQAGWLLGKNEKTYSLQTINGIGYKKYNAGIGVAFDKYGYKSVPVFVDLRYSLFKGRRHAFQVYGDAGISIPLNSNSLQAKYPSGAVWHTMHPSFYGETGFSYSIALIHKLKLVAGAGFNYKTFKYTETIYTGDIVIDNLDTDYTYRYSKYVLRIGLGF